MANLKTYLQSLINSAIHNTLPASSGSVSHSVPPQEWTDFVAPFDGIAVMGSETNGCEAINFYSGACHALIPMLNERHGFAWIVIKKGDPISAYCNGNVTVQLVLVPNIQSSL